MVSVAIVLFHVVVSAVVSAHAAVFKRDARSAIAWVCFVWFVPTFGAVAYALLGVNRVHRRARAMRELKTATTQKRTLGEHGSVAESVRDVFPLARVTEQICRRPLRAGNTVVPLENGDEAYPAMLAAIERAQRTVSLCTYIFDDDALGHRFVDALARAKARGVETRVLIDGVGLRYSWPPASRALRALGVRVAVFLPTLSPLRVPFANLRNHRKILVLDGDVAFTGGMNIRGACVLEGEGPARADATADVHFRIEGPLVADIADVFADDWAFAAGEVIERASAPPPGTGDVVARAIDDGPEDDRHPLRWTLLGALAASRSAVRIVTPYFLPDQTLIAALNTCALRGVRVEIVLPRKSNIRLVNWAEAATLWQTLEHGCHVFLQPAPFDHTKLMTIDGTWSLIGSANWDARSLRLNFELDVECYGSALAGALDRVIEARIRKSDEVTLADVDKRPIFTRVRDGAARLLSPYL